MIQSLVKDVVWTNAESTLSAITDCAVVMEPFAVIFCVNSTSVIAVEASRAVAEILDAEMSSVTCIEEAVMSVTIAIDAFILPTNAVSVISVFPVILLAVNTDDEMF